MAVDVHAGVEEHETGGARAVVYHALLAQVVVERQLACADSDTRHLAVCVGIVGSQCRLGVRRRQLLAGERRVRDQRRDVHGQAVLDSGQVEPGALRLVAGRRAEPTHAHKFKGGARVGVYHAQAPLAHCWVEWQHRRFRLHCCCRRRSQVG
jgi:hypothetical protein